MIQTSSPRVQERGCQGAEGHCHSVEFRSRRHWMLSTQEVPRLLCPGLFSSQPCSPQPSCWQMMDKEASFRALLHTAPHVPLWNTSNHPAQGPAPPRSLRATASGRQAPRVRGSGGGGRNQGPPAPRPEPSQGLWHPAHTTHIPVHPHPRGEQRPTGSQFKPQLQCCDP